MLGERIALLRRGKGWNQAELARHLHISTSAVGMYEQGRREPSLEGSADYLLTGTPMVEKDKKAITTAAGAVGDFRGGGFSREELSVLFASLLSEP